MATLIVIKPKGRLIVIIKNYYNKATLIVINKMYYKKATLIVIIITIRVLLQ